MITGASSKHDRADCHLPSPSNSLPGIPSRLRSSKPRVARFSSSPRSDVRLGLVRRRLGENRSRYCVRFGPRPPIVVCRCISFSDASKHEQRVANSHSPLKKNSSCGFLQVVGATVRTAHRRRIQASRASIQRVHRLLSEERCNECRICASRQQIGRLRPSIAPLSQIIVVRPVGHKQTNDSQMAVHAASCLTPAGCASVMTR
jgi:hypothetical protein